MRPSHTFPASSLAPTRFVSTISRTSRTSPRTQAVARALIITLVALVGEWSVHQIEYAIEYRQRFAAVMDATPHRLYMAPLGAFLGSVAFVVFALVLMVLCAHGARRRHLESLLPANLRRFVPGALPEIKLRNIAGTAVTLACLQVLLYLLQENLESFAVTGAMPGLDVLIAPQHATALPLHLVTALAASLFLWIMYAWRGALRNAIEAAEILVLLVRSWRAPVSRSPVVPWRVPACWLAAGARSLRSPPLSTIRIRA